MLPCWPPAAVCQMAAAGAAARQVATAAVAGEGQRPVLAGLAALLPHHRVGARACGGRRQAAVGTCLVSMMVVHRSLWSGIAREQQTAALIAMGLELGAQGAGFPGNGGIQAGQRANAPAARMPVLSTTPFLTDLAGLFSYLY